jgi:hypothetical protein
MFKQFFRLGAHAAVSWIILSCLLGCRILSPGLSVDESQPNGSGFSTPKRSDPNNTKKNPIFVTTKKIL